MSTSSSPRMRILDMIADGKLSAEEGLRLLDALSRTEDPVQKMKLIHKSFSTGMVFIRIIEKTTNKLLVSIRIPFSLIATARKLGAKITSHDGEFNLDEFRDSLDSSQPGDVFRVEKEKEVIELIVE